MRIALKNFADIASIERFCLSECIVDEGKADIVLDGRAENFTLLWNSGAVKPVKLSIDVAAFVAKQTSFPVAKKSAFNQALGRSAKTILDASGGWAGDVLLMCSQGYKVDVIERNGLMALLLSNAMQVLSHTAWAKKHLQAIPRVIHQDASAYISSADLNYDCVYFDPMFPEKRKKSAAPNKYMQFLRFLLEGDDDASLVVRSALKSQVKRLVVKRPHYAPSLLVSRAPNTQFVSKLVHYDVYQN